MRVFVAELGRFLSRRTIAVLLLLAVAVAAVLTVAAAYDTRALSRTEMDAAQEVLRKDTAAYQQELQACRKDPGQYLDARATAADCEQLRPQLHSYLVRTPLNLAAEVDERGTVLMVLLAAIGLLVGATFAGADWADRSIGTQLLVETRRERMWLAKAGAVTVAMTAAAALVTAGFWGALRVIALLREVPVPAGTWSEVLATSGRGLALVAAATLGGFALTMLLRRTVATLGLLFGYTLLVEALAATLPVTRMTQWTVPHNVLGWVKDGVQINDRTICSGERIGCQPWYSLGAEHGAAYLGVLLAITVLVSLVAFGRRDVP